MPAHMASSAAAIRSTSAHRRRFPDVHRDGRVGVPAVQDAAGVDRDQVAVPQHPRRRRDAVDDLLVHRGADRRREAVIALEVRDGAGVGDHVGTDRVDVGGRRPRLDRSAHGGDGSSQHDARSAHRLQLTPGLELQAGAPHDALRPPTRRPGTAVDADHVDGSRDQLRRGRGHCARSRRACGAGPPAGGRRRRPRRPADRRTPAPAASRCGTATAGC